MKLFPSSLLPQGVEEEEEAEPYSEEEAPAVASETQPSAADITTQGEEEEVNETQEEGQSKEETKAEEKGNLAGERQSGDGQVRPVCQPTVAYRLYFTFEAELFMRV